MKFSALWTRSGSLPELRGDAQFNRTASAPRWAFKRLLLEPRPPRCLPSELRPHILPPGHRAGRGRALLHRYAGDPAPGRLVRLNVRAEGEAPFLIESGANCSLLRGGTRHGELLRSNSAQQLAAQARQRVHAGGRGRLLLLRQLLLLLLL
jgi:hypothetical protein